MNKKQKEEVLIGAVALLALLFLGTFSYSLDKQNSPTGAVSGESYVFDLCLTKYGRDLDGNYEYEKIEDCREYVRSLEKTGDNKGTPRLYLSSDRTAFQNNENSPAEASFRD